LGEVSNWKRDQRQKRAAPKISGVGGKRLGKELVWEGG